MALAKLDTEDRPHGAAAPLASPRQPLRIVHCVGASQGELVRRVADLAEAQAAARHSVGIIISDAADDADPHLKRVEAALTLGIYRLPNRRDAAPPELRLTGRLVGAVRKLNPDILHAHGSRGGAIGRMVGTILRASGSRVARIYSPSGATLDIDPRSARGRLAIALEQVLARTTDGFVFDSRYEADAFAAHVARPRTLTAVAPSGPRAEDFAPVRRAADARDFVFMCVPGEPTGTNVFLKALALMRERSGRAPTAFVVGPAPDGARYRALAGELGIAARVAFVDPMTPRTAFRLAHVMVMPSSAEPSPGLVLAALAAGMPVVAPNVGAIAEIFGDDAGRLVPPGDPVALAEAMTAGGRGCLQTGVGAVGAGWSGPRKR
jgi:glycosyltransferase involved in cell wall biosynthesis